MKYQWPDKKQLDLALQAINQNSLQFGGVSLLVVGDFLQLPPVDQKGVFAKAGKGSYRLSMDGCGKNFGYNSWLKPLGTAVTQNSLNDLIGFGKVCKRTIQWCDAKKSFR